MTHDPRWILFIAWPFGACAVHIILRSLNLRKWLIIPGTLLVGIFLLIINMQLAPTVEDIMKPSAKPAPVDTPRPLAQAPPPETQKILKPKEKEVKKEPVMKEPTLFSVKDPNLKFFRRYNIPKEINQVMDIGNCPSYPCFSVKPTEIRMDELPPKIVFGICSNVQGLICPNELSSALGLGVTLKEGCGFKLRSGYYDLIFEVINDRATTLEACIGVFPGTLKPGTIQTQGTCP